MPRLLLPLLLIATLATAAPVPYRLDPAHTVVTFTYTLGRDRQTGRMPVKSARLLIDLDRLSASRIDVVLDARRARAGFFLATDVLRGPGMLDTARYPEIRFRSTAIRGSPRAATVTGLLSLHGVTRPVTMRAGLYRAPGTEPDNRDDLTVLMTGSVSRAAFGITGHAGDIGDRIGLTIIARITKQP